MKKIKRTKIKTIIFLVMLLLGCGCLGGCSLPGSRASGQGLSLAGGGSIFAGEENDSARKESDSARKESDSAREESDSAREESGPTEDDADAMVGKESSICCVYICGQVKNEGVYEVSSGSRIYQVIELAGGLKKGADTAALNQAAKVEDGQMIYVPKKGESVNAGGSLAGAETSAAGAGISSASGSTASAGGKVNINTAGKEELMTLNGIGEARAESIIHYREKNGSFSKPEDLKQVEGIGDGIFSKLEDAICTG